MIKIEKGELEIAGVEGIIFGEVAIIVRTWYQHCKEKEGEDIANILLRKIVADATKDELPLDTIQDDVETLVSDYMKWKAGE